MNNIIDGKKVSLELGEKLIEKISLLDKKLKLVVVSVGNDPASKVYVSQKEKKAISVGYDFLNLHFDSILEDDLIKEIEKLNNDDTVTGVIVQLPLPSYLNKDKILNTVSPFKDVDGLTNNNFLKLIKKEESLLPCTPKGIISLLDYYNISYDYKTVVIVGRSELVGLPLFHLLLNKNATIMMCHSKTKNLSEYTKNADILIVAVGKKELITPDMIKEGSIIIDVGINRFDDKLYGDVSALCLEKAALMTPVPGGVGPMTVISLMENVYLAHLLQEKNKTEKN